MMSTLKGVLIPLVLCLLIFESIMFLHHALDAPGVLHLKDAYITESDAAVAPDFLRTEKTMSSLPDNWQISRPGKGESVWYELTFSMHEQPAKLWALFIPRANMNVAVFLNDVEIGNSGSFVEPMSRNWARPLYYTIPASMLLLGQNTLHIHLKSYAYEGGGLSQLLVGPDDVLLPLFEERDFLQIDIAIVTFFFNMFAALVALSLWYLRRTDVVYGWFALICLSSALFVSNHFIKDIPVSRDLWHFSVHVSIGWFAFSLMMFVQHFLDCANKRWVRIFICYMLISSVVIVFLGNIIIALFWQVGSLAMASYACVILFKAWFQRKQLVDLVLFIAVFATLTLGFHDWYTRLSGLQFSYPVLMHLGSPLMLMSISWVLVTRFVEFAKEHEQFNAILLQRVESTKLALNQENQKVQQLMQTEARVGERNRIMQDLHDGLGGYLLSAHSIARLQDVDQGLQQALNDAMFWLRTSIDTLDSANEDLGSLLGTLRYRLEAQLKSCGIVLHWHMDDLSPYEFSSEVRLHIIRIVQESIVNVIKHAGASDLFISTTVESDQSMLLEIADNGCGFSNLEGGHGMSNMRERAESCNAHMTIMANQPTGCRLQFQFNLAS